MSRRIEIYIDSDTWRSLWLLSQADPGVRDDFGVQQKVSPDYLANAILRQAMREQHPQLLEHQKKLDKLEKETIEALRNEQTRIPRTGNKGA